jgi:acid phosphatase type 7
MLEHKYLVTRGGGGTLYNPEQQDDPASWHEFTTRLIFKVHSLTLAEADSTALLGRKLSLGGVELDRFPLNK